MKLKFLLIPVTMLSQAGAAVVLLTDDFSYADGALVANSGGNWVSHSGTAGTLPVAGGAAQVSQDSGSEDAHTQFATQDSGILTASFDLGVDAAGMSGTDFEYFAHFMTDGSFNFRARIDVVAPTVGGDYTLGISTLSSTAETVMGVDFTFGSVVPVVLAFDFDTGLASVTAGGTTITSTTVSAGQSLDSFALRQSNSSSDEAITVDNLVIMTSIPEPSSALLGGLSLLALLRRRR